MSTATESYYTVLGVPRTATAAEIKAAFHELIKQVHPDVLVNAPPYWQKQAEERAKDINEANSVLSDPDKRRLYDQQLDAFQRSQARPAPSTPRRDPTTYHGASGARRAPRTQKQSQPAASRSYTQTSPPPPPPPRATPPQQWQTSPQPPNAKRKPAFTAAKVFGVVIAGWIVFQIFGSLISGIGKGSLRPLQLGTITAASSVKGFRNYHPQHTFLPGSIVHLYGEALDINSNGRADVSFAFRVVAPNGMALSATNWEYVQNTEQPHSWYGDKIKIPTDALPGPYIIQLSVRDNLTGRTAEGTALFTVEGPKSADDMNVPERATTPDGDKSQGANNLPPRPFDLAHQNADTALAAGRLLEPVNDNALYWARRAKELGDPSASQLEQHVVSALVGQVDVLRQSRNYDEALRLIDQIATNTGFIPELRDRQDSIQQEKAEYQAQESRLQQGQALAVGRTYVLRHRHVAGLNLSTLQSSRFYCQGTFSVGPDRIVRYDCTSTNDPRGRCEHLAFAAAAVREAKLRDDGGLRVSTKSGNFDFYGDASSIEQALQSILNAQQK